MQVVVQFSLHHAHATARAARDMGTPICCSLTMLKGTGCCLHVLRLYTAMPGPPHVTVTCFSLLGIHGGDHLVLLCSLRKTWLNVIVAMQTKKKRDRVHMLDLPQQAGSSNLSIL